MLTLSINSYTVLIIFLRHSNKAFVSRSLYNVMNKQHNNEIIQFRLQIGTNLRVTKVHSFV